MSNLSQGRPDRLRDLRKVRLPKSGYGIPASGPPVKNLRIVIKAFDGALSAIRNRWGKRLNACPLLYCKSSRFATGFFIARQYLAKRAFGTSASSCRRGTFPPVSRSCLKAGLSTHCDKKYINIKGL